MSLTQTKCFVLDTNVLLADPGSIYSFEEHDVVIPLVVLEELDHQKSRQDEVGKSARAVIRELDLLRSQGNMFHGIALRAPAKGTLKIVKRDENAVNSDIFPSELNKNAPDNIIISVAAQIEQNNRVAQHYSAVVLVSKDINVRLKCDSLELKSADYYKMRIASDKDGIYGGVTRVEVSPDVIQEFYENNKLDATLKVLDDANLQPNQFVVMKDGTESSSAIGRFIIDQVDGMPRVCRFAYANKDVSVFGLKPKNKEQLFALELLLDPNVKLVSLMGPAGTGKTLLSVAAGLHQIKGISGIENGPYNKLIIARPIQAMGKDIGFLPGTLEEKMDPWIAPIKDSLNFLFGKPKHNNHGNNRKNSEDDLLSLHIEKKKIEVEALTYIRGRSIPDAFIIIDEAQNLSVHELKTIITRVSEGTKIVLTGDIEQIDNTHVDAFTNGLTYAIEKFKQFPIAGHVTMQKGERSELATLASKIL